MGKRLYMNSEYLINISKKYGRCIFSHICGSKCNRFERGIKNIKVKTNLSCRQKCKYCIQNRYYTDFSSKEISIKDINEHFIKFRNSNLTLFGGEFCLLNDNIRQDIYSAVKKYNINCSILTAQTDNDIPEFINQNIHIIDFSIKINKNYNYNIVLFHEDLNKIINFLELNKDHKFLLFLDRIKRTYSEDDIVLLKKILSFENISMYLLKDIKTNIEKINILQDKWIDIIDNVCCSSDIALDFTLEDIFKK
jgi:hypothetical protein